MCHKRARGASISFAMCSVEERGLMVEWDEVRITSSFPMTTSTLLPPFPPSFLSFPFQQRDDSEATTLHQELTLLIMDPESVPEVQLLVAVWPKSGSDERRWGYYGGRYVVVRRFCFKTVGDSMECIKVKEM
ncbi:hypothetical protein PHJA_001587000 [Phtheirospermum japonicum]|uniref:Uncharacterized protein n=1 Tax=Phtheirospermum japonicum TaxID=374723 RepID=A0A830C5N3_9LAMI|nr:hypothetical protein PHJA_001587000 [Phtheirospermum japonicum]